MTAGEAVEAIEDIASRFAALDDDMRLSITAHVDGVLYEVKDGDLVRLGPCGECPVGTCDDCDICTWQAALPGAREHDAIVHPPAEVPA